MQTNPAVEQNKTLNGPRVCGISPVGKENVYSGNDLLKSHALSSEWKTERVREDASGDREDGEEDDDELPCVIGESEGGQGIYAFRETEVDFSVDYRMGFPANT